MLFFLTTALHAQGSSTGTQCTGSLVGTRTGRNGCVEEKISNPRIVKPVANHYTDYYILRPIIKLFLKLYRTQLSQW